MAALQTAEVTLHGHRIAYRTAGGPPSADRPVLLLVHGIGSSSRTWNALGAELSEHYTVVAPDLLGFGASDTPRHDYSVGAQANLLRDLMIVLGIEHATLVGHSLGGGIVMQLAYQHPARCERLVLIASGGLGPEVVWFLRAATVPSAERFLPIVFSPLYRPVTGGIRNVMRRAGLWSAPLEEQWRGSLTLVDPDRRSAFMRTARSVLDRRGQTISAHDRLYLAGHVPTLVVWGKRDRIIPWHHANVVRDALPGSDLLLLDQAGHFPHVTEPHVVATAITRFVAANPPAVHDESAWGRPLHSGRSTDTSTPD